MDASRTAVWSSAHGKVRRLASAAVVVVCVGLALSASLVRTQAHGIVGNRLFPGTLSFEDPAVMEELVLTAISLKHPDDQNNVVDNAITWEYSRLLTPTLSLSIGGGFVHRNWSGINRSGFDQTDLMVKTLLYQNDLHEVMVSAGLAAGIGRSGALGVGANQLNTVQPSVFFGKGFGDLPSGLAWLRPFAVTGVAAVEFPFGTTTTALDNSVPGELTPDVARTNTVVHWGLSIQYSTFYLTPRFSAGRLPKDDPLNQFIPLVEFAVDTPVGGAPVATMNPGIIYVAD
jgi:hypothetical protein